MKFGKFLATRQASFCAEKEPPTIPYKRLKKLLKKRDATPSFFLDILERVCDQLECEWRFRALACLRANAKDGLASGTFNCMARPRPHKDSAEDLALWAALNALALRKIIKKFDKEGRRRRLLDSSWGQSGCSGLGVDWMQRVAMARLSFLRSALRVEVFALATLFVQHPNTDLATVHQQIPALPFSFSTIPAKDLCGGDNAVAPSPSFSPVSSSFSSVATPPGDGLADGCFAAELSCSSFVSELTSCQLCFEVMVEPVAFAACGHPVCRPCFDRMVAVHAETAAAAAAAATPAVAARCPVCRSTSANVKLVQLNRLAQASHPEAHSLRSAELRARRRAVQRRQRSKAARSFFLNRTDLLVAVAPGITGPCNAPRPTSAVTPRHVGRFFAEGGGAPLPPGLRLTSALAPFAELEVLGV